MTVPATVDRSALDRLVEWGGDKLLGQMLRLFLENSGERVRTLEAALTDDGDLEVVHREAHSLKSSAANLGALRASAAAERLERVARDGDLEGARSAVDELTDALEVARAELRRIYEELPR